VIAIPAREEGMFSIKIQQLYDYIDSTHWFPVQLNTDLIIKNASIAIDSTSKTQLKMMGRGKSYISEINLKPDLKRSQFGAIEVDVQPDAYSQPEDVWNKYRIDSLTQRDQKTYLVIDSIGKANNFDRLTRRLDAMMNGKVTLGYIDLYMDNLFKVNHHEGLRLGLKLSTSDKVSTWFKVGGYGAYGFKDKEFKYGADGKIIFDRFRDFSLTAAYFNDVDEAGADPKFDQSRNLLNPERFRDIMVERMDQTRSYEARLNSRLFKYLTAGAGFSTYKRIPLYSYDYVNATSEDIPYVNLYNARSSYRPFTFHSPGSFATMRMDEFTADRYASFFFSHNFGKLLFRSKYFSPEPELVTNLGIGSLSKPENHIKEGIKGYEKGYYESGVVVNKLLRLGLTDVGLAWFYRYGPYALPTPKENMAWKIAFQFVL
jgi:hypothetical protein